MSAVSATQRVVEDEVTHVIARNPRQARLMYQPGAVSLAEAKALLERRRACSAWRDHKVYRLRVVAEEVL